MQHHPLTEKIKTSVDTNGKAYIVLSNATKHNAFDEVVLQALKQLLDTYAHDTEVRMLIISAEGKSFSAGADLTWMQKMANYSLDENVADARVLGEVMHALYYFPKPTLVSVQGAAYGGALGLIACCDFAIASTSATFCLSEVKLGLIPAVISPFVIEAMGKRAARRFALTGEVFGAEEALRLGLIAQICEPDLLAEQLLQVSDRLLKNGPEAMQVVKALMNEVGDSEIDEDLLEFTSRKIAEIRVSPEAQEGLRAFFEKRTANW